MVRKTIAALRSDCGEEPAASTPSHLARRRTPLLRRTALPAALQDLARARRSRSASPAECPRSPPPVGDASASRFPSGIRHTKAHQGTPRHTKAHQGTPRHTKAHQGTPDHRKLGLIKFGKCTTRPHPTLDWAEFRLRPNRVLHAQIPDPCCPTPCTSPPALQDPAQRSTRRMPLFAAPSRSPPARRLPSVTPHDLHARGFRTRYFPRPGRALHEPWSTITSPRDITTDGAPWHTRPS